MCVFFMYRHMALHREFFFVDLMFDCTIYESVALFIISVYCSLHITSLIFMMGEGGQYDFS